MPRRKHSFPGNGDASRQPWIAANLNKGPLPGLIACGPWGNRTLYLIFATRDRPSWTSSRQRRVRRATESPKPLLRVLDLDRFTCLTRRSHRTTTAAPTLSTKDSSDHYQEPRHATLQLQTTSQPANQHWSLPRLSSRLSMQICAYQSPRSLHRRRPNLFRSGYSRLSVDKERC